MSNLQEKQFQYGWFSFRPGLLRFLNSPKWFLFSLCQYFFTQSVIINGVFPASISTIEQRFGYSSSMMGVLNGTYDIAALLFSPIVGYLGETRKKPLWCSCGLLVMGLGYFVFLLPHMMGGYYEAGAANVLAPILCGMAGNASNATSGCGNGGDSNMGLYIIFLLGMFLVGIGATPMVVLAFPYLDENLPPNVLPIYMGFYYASGILGVLAGSVLGSVFLSIYVDIGVSTSLTVDDERWVGAWWLGFAIFSAVAVFWSFWMLGFPKEFPATKEIREEEKRKGNKNVAGSVKARYVKISQIFKATKHLFTYPSYIFLTMAICAEELLITSVSAFMPKIIQSQFQFTASTASILFGVIAGTSALSGNLIGAYINKKLKLDCTKAARMCFIVSVFSLVCTIPTFISCDSTQIAGVNSPYANSVMSTGVKSSCNDNCGCVDSIRYNPVCGGDTQTYFSPCHAGCRVGALKNNTFFNCSCVAELENNTWSGGKSQRGACREDCGLVVTVFYLFAVFLVAFSTFLNNIPASFVTLRCVPFDQRSYAIGIQWNFIRLLGTVPGPILFGYFIDQACILWDYKCGERGSCRAYNKQYLGLAVFLLCSICKVISTTGFGLSWIFCRRQFTSTKIKDVIPDYSNGEPHKDEITSL